MKIFKTTNQSDKKYPKMNYLKTKRIVITMKLIVIISFVFTFSIAASSYAQVTRLNIDITAPAPVKSVLKMIEAQSNFRFFYTSELADLDRTVTASMNDKTIYEALNLLFAGTPVGYRVLENNFVVLSLEEILQGITITGIVTDTYGEPLPGVSIQIKGTTQGTATDANGAYSLQAPGENATLIFSYIGFSPQEITVGNRRTINIVMADNTRQLEEVVVIGYGTTRRADLIGSVSSVSAAQLKDIPITSAAMAITGKMPGVQVTQTEGSPDAEIKIRVRGGGSITQDNSPLYIIDGFPVDNMGAISPTDIATIDVLKDASSTAIYGARGANGVIIITTKSGYEGKPTISYNMYYGLKKNPKFYDVLSPYDYAFWQYELMGPNQIDSYEYFLGKFEDMKLYKDMQGTNWQKECLGRTGNSLYNNLSLSGGTKSIKYNMSVTRNNDEEVMLGSENARTTFAAKTTYVVNDWLDIEMNIRLSDQMIKGVGTSGSLDNMIYFRPIQGISDLVSSESRDDYELVSTFALDPVKQILDTYRRNANQRFSYNGAFNLKFLKDFTYRFSFNTDYIKQNIKLFYGLNTPQAYDASSMPLAQKDNIAGRSWQITNTVTYHKRDFLPDQNLNIMLGQEIYSNTSEQLRASVRYLPKYIDAEGGLAMMNMGTADPIYTMDAAPDNLSSFFGRAIYDYKGKYSLSATIRADGSGKFAPGYQWGYFPSAGAYWRISDENFMNGTETWLSTLKLRASFGASGNNRIRSDAWRKTLGVGTGDLFMDGPLGDRTPFIRPLSELANPTLKWETTVTRNLGLDFALWNYRLNGTLEFYHNTTKDLLISATIPATTGYTTQMQNIGQTSNRGIEIMLNGIIIDRRDFRLSGSFNIAFNKNRIDKLGETKRWFETALGGDRSSMEFLIEEGGKVGLMYGYELDGNGMYTFDDFTYNSANGTYTIKPGVPDNSSLIMNVGNNFGPGAIKFKKQPTSDPGNMSITTDDMVLLGDANPKHTGGFSISAEYKGIDFSAFFNWVYGNSIFNTNKLGWSTQWGARLYRNILGELDSNNRFTHYNPETGAYVSDPAELQALNKDAKYWSCSVHRAPLHSWAIEDGSFLRLNNMTIGYSIPKTIISRAKIEQLRVYFTGYNLWIWTNYSGYDPEVDNIRYTPLTPGCDASAYPKFRSYNIGLNLTF